MAISPELLSAYRFHAQTLRAFAKGKRALDCIAKARGDVASGRKRYADQFQAWPAVSWSAEKPDIAYVQSIQGAGLRHVGNVEAETRRGDIWARRDTCGWYTYPYGDVAKDGTGLCWGVVYQLPARDGKARFVAGYIFGGCSEDLPTVDFGTIYESTQSQGGWYDANPCDHDAAKDAARAADSMAQHAAETERDYQTAWLAGSAYASAMDERAELKTELRALLGERRQAMRDLAAQGIGVGVKGGALCAAIERRARDMIETISELAVKANNLANGEGTGHNSELCFWTGDATLKAAFNEGACRDVLA